MSAEGRHVRRKVPGRLWWLLLMVVALGVLLPFWAAVLALGAWDRLRGHQQPDPVYPGVRKVYAPSDFASFSDRDGW